MDAIELASELIKLHRYDGSRGIYARFYSAAKIPTINVGAGNMNLLRALDERVALVELKQVENLL